MVLYYLGVVIAIFGAALLVVDLLEGMPIWWTVGEGPFSLVFGAVIFAWARKLRKRENQRC